jgi:hypothetical protein
MFMMINGDQLCFLTIITGGIYRDMVILLVMFMGFDVGKNSGFTTKNRDVFWDSSR